MQLALSRDMYFGWQNNCFSSQRSCFLHSFLSSECLGPIGNWKSAICPSLPLEAEWAAAKDSSATATSVESVNFGQAQGVCRSNGHLRNKLAQHHLRHHSLVADVMSPASPLPILPGAEHLPQSSAVPRKMSLISRL